MNNRKSLFVLVTLLGGIAVCLGAFGAHALKPYLNDYQKDIYNKAVFYQFVHVLAALVALLSAQLFSQKAFHLPVLLFILGVLCFSGSLYILSLNHILQFPTVLIGPITPIGGVFFISGWLTFAYQLYKNV
ncbi:MAG: DUF423 domain-containing protein [Chitinophagales bacterium]